MPRRKKDLVALIRQARAENWPVLDLSNCPLAELIGDICTLVQLEELSLAHCHLRALPDAIGDLTNLRKLDLRENSLTRLPESLCGLKQLKSIDLSLNRLDSVSKTVEQWILSIPSHHISHTALAEELFRPPFVMPSNPRLLLIWLESALSGYGQANSADDHGGHGFAIRQESDRVIAEIFAHVPALKSVLPDFYDDFCNRRFEGFGQKSEQLLRRNPFKLPTSQDEKWLAENRDNPAVIQMGCLTPKTDAPASTLRFIGDGYQGDITTVCYGEVTVSNQPYADDERYFADYQVTLYRAGPERLYVELEQRGYGTSLTWHVSEDSGRTWNLMPAFLADSLNAQKQNWRVVNEQSK